MAPPCSRGTRLPSGSTECEVAGTPATDHAQLTAWLELGDGERQRDAEWGVHATGRPEGQAVAVDFCSRDGRTPPRPRIGVDENLPHRVGRCVDVSADGKHWGGIPADGAAESPTTRRLPARG